MSGVVTVWAIRRNLSGGERLSPSRTANTGGMLGHSEGRYAAQDAANGCLNSYIGPAVAVSQDILAAVQITVQYCPLGVTVKIIRT